MYCPFTLQKRSPVMQLFSVYPQGDRESWQSWLMLVWALLPAEPDLPLERLSGCCWRAFNFPAPSLCKLCKHCPRSHGGESCRWGCQWGAQSCFPTVLDPQSPNNQNREARRHCCVFNVWPGWWILISVGGILQIVFQGYLLIGCWLPMFFFPQTDKNLSASLPSCYLIR